MSDGYYVCSELPEPFRAADLLMAQQHPQPKIIREPKVVPMPTITENRGVTEGPIRVTEEWYTKEKIKQMKKQEKARRSAEVEMIQLIARKDMLRFKLGELDPSKVRDSKRIAAINIELRNIEIGIHQLEEQHGISATDLDHGSRVGRFIGRLKHAAKKVGKKIKKFYKRNAELINGIASIVLPVLGTVLIKKIFKL